VRIDSPRRTTQGESNALGEDNSNEDQLYFE
jgi:hypothetical protein